MAQPRSISMNPASGFKALLPVGLALTALAAGFTLEVGWQHQPVERYFLVAGPDFVPVEPEDFIHEACSKRETKRYVAEAVVNHLCYL